MGLLIHRFSLRAKVLLQRIANRFGYRIERVHDHTRPIDVFDLAVRKLACDRGKQFTFLQIGANDGKHEDPIQKYITTYHWAGLLVEPQPEVFNRLVANYSGELQLRFENAAVATTDGSTQLYTVRRPLNGNKTPDYLASFSRELLARQLPIGTPIVQIQVAAMTLKTLLSKHGITSLDLLQIDTEGFDFEIIRMFDFESIKPAIIHFEHRHLSEKDRKKACDFLVSHGYQLWFEGQDTTAICGV